MPRLALVALLAVAQAALADGGIAPRQDAGSPPAASVAVDSVPDAPPVPLLWKVSDDDSSVYLLGAFHLLKPSDYPLSGDVEDAFADADALMFEMSPDEMQSPSLPLEMARAAKYADGRTLRDDLSPAAWARLESYASGHGLSLSTLQAYEPWFVGLTVSILEMTRQGLDPKLGLDQHFAAAAKAAGKRTGGFETGSQQIALLDGMDRQEQVQFLDEALDEAANGSDEVDRLHAAWRAGDVATLRDGMAAEMGREYPQLYRRINVERNDAWLRQIDGILAAGHGADTLVVVGTLHLLGADGLVEKLRAQGYGVERICSACDPGQAGAAPAASTR